MPWISCTRLCNPPHLREHCSGYGPAGTGSGSETDSLEQSLLGQPLQTHKELIFPSQITLNILLVFTTEMQHIGTSVGWDVGQLLLRCAWWQTVTTSSRTCRIHLLTYTLRWNVFSCFRIRGDVWGVSPGLLRERCLVIRSTVLGLQWARRVIVWLWEGCSTEGGSRKTDRGSGSSSISLTSFKMFTLAVCRLWSRTWRSCWVLRGWRTCRITRRLQTVSEGGCEKAVEGSIRGPFTSSCQTTTLCHLTAALCSGLSTSPVFRATFGVKMTSHSGWRLTWHNRGGLFATSGAKRFRRGVWVSCQKR